MILVCLCKNLPTQFVTDITSTKVTSSQYFFNQVLIHLFLKLFPFYSHYHVWMTCRPARGLTAHICLRFSQLTQTKFFDGIYSDHIRNAIFDRLKTLFRITKLNLLIFDVVINQSHCWAVPYNKGWLLCCLCT